MNLVDKICFLVASVYIPYIAFQNYVRQKEFVFSDKIVKEIALNHKGTVGFCNYLKTKVENTEYKGRAWVYALKLVRTVD